MKFIEMKTQEQFKELKPGDLLLVQWSDYGINHMQNCKKVMLYNIHGLYPGSAEVICRKKDNHYFNYNTYLGGTSVAEFVYKLILSDQQI